MHARRGMVAAWAASIATLAIADWILNRRQDGSTMSEATRYTFHTHTPTGRLAFTITWTGLYLWFWQHICVNASPEPAHLD